MGGAWLVIAAGDDRQHGGNDGYDDVPADSYSWDDTVPNHAALEPGDPIVLWDKKRLIGASIIERIDEGATEKPVYRCSRCGLAHIKRRKTLQPPWRCFNCSRDFSEPIIRLQEVHTYRSHHEAGWVDLDGVLAGEKLRSLCVSPRSQLSLRPLRWEEFRAEVQQATSGTPLIALDAREARVREGHSQATVRIRLGQGRFRRDLLAEYGRVCALTGATPESALEAAHLYSYADIGEHHAHGGLLLRRDVHRLFDRGEIAVDPQSLRIEISPHLMAYPTYRSLQGQPLAVEVDGAHRSWLAGHWAQHRSEGRGGATA